MTDIRKIPGLPMALQAICAVLAIECLAQFTKLDRVYWAEIAACMTICQSFGESVRKSLRRSIGTAAGALSGALLCLLLDVGEMPLWTHFAIVAAAALLALRCYPENYQAYSFWLCLGVIVLLDAQTRDGHSMAPVRIYEALLGCAFGLTASLLILPSHAYEKARREIEGGLKEMVDLLELARPAFAGRPLPQDFDAKRKAFNAKTDALDTLLLGVEAEDALYISTEDASPERLIALKALRQQASDLFERLPFQPAPEPLRGSLDKWAGIFLDDLAERVQGAKDKEPDSIREDFRIETMAILNEHPELKYLSANALSAMYWLISLRVSAMSFIAH